MADAAPRRRRWAHPKLIDAVIVVALAGAVFVVHDVGYALDHPFWLDESWVADSLRAPLGRLPFLTSSTPLGFSFLLRLIPGAAGSQRARLVPLVFCSLAAVAGYVLGAELRLNRYLSGLMVGAAVLVKRRVDDPLPGHNPADGGGENLGGSVFYDEAGYSGPHRSAQVAGPPEGRRITTRQAGT
jgi:hypothetical protein